MIMKKKQMIEVFRIKSAQDLAIAHEIRFEAFVEEQQVPADEELEFEEESHHYLAMTDGLPAGTARWRFTEKGVKLERFAVKKDYRSQGIGSALVEFILKEVHNHPEFKGKEIYLHAQISAMPLYSKFGFSQTGGMFDEAGIMHYKMIKIH
jgi:predicted GNAT family N-acyltransferase